MVDVVSSSVLQVPVQLDLHKYLQIQLMMGGVLIRVPGPLPSETLAGVVGTAEVAGTPKINKHSMVAGQNFA